MTILLTQPPPPAAASTLVDLIVDYKGLLILCQLFGDDDLDELSESSESSQSPVPDEHLADGAHPDDNANDDDRVCKFY